MSVNKEQAGAVAGNAMAVGGSMAYGSLLGMYVANEILTPTVEYLPGFEAKVKFAPQEGATVDSVVTTFHLPDVADTHMPLMHGIHAQITSFNPPRGNGRAMEQYAGLVSDFNNTVVSPTAETLFNHVILKGGGAGALAAGILAGGILWQRRKRLAEERKDREQIHRFRARAETVSGVADQDWLSDEAEQAEERLEARLGNSRRWRKRYRWLGGAAAALAAGLVATSMSNAIATQPDQTQKVFNEDTAALVADRPEIRDMTCTGFGCDLVRTGIYGVMQIVSTTRDDVREGAYNRDTAYVAFAKTTGGKFIDRPRTRVIQHLSDAHCDRAVYEHSLPELVKEIKPGIIVNTGDTFTNSNKMPYEKECFTGLVKAVDKGSQATGIPVTMINVAGNHDPKDDIEMETGKVKVITLTEDNPVATVDDQTFVGLPDPSVTVWSPTTPSDPDELGSELAKAGSRIAEEACKITEKTGVPPIVVSHREAMSYEATVRGCASLVLNGHTHEAKPAQAFIAENGNTVMQHTADSLSGVHIGFTLWQSPQKDASATTIYQDRDTGSFVGFVTPTIHPNETAEIVVQEPPYASTLATDDTRKMDFLKKYSKTYKPSAAAEAHP